METEVHGTAKVLITWIVFLMFRLAFKIFVAQLKYSSRYFFLISFQSILLKRTILRYLYWSLMYKVIIVSLLGSVIFQMLHLSGLQSETISKTFCSCLMLFSIQLGQKEKPDKILWLLRQMRWLIFNSLV